MATRTVDTAKHARPARTRRTEQFDSYMAIADVPKRGTKPIWLYLRRSNRHNDDGDAVPRQLLNAQERWNEKSGWTIMGAFIDVDSASKSAEQNDVIRKGWEQLGAAIDNGTVTAVGFDKLDRLYRFTRKQLEWVENCQKHDVEINSIKDPEVIFQDTPMGHVALSVAASMAQSETMTMSTRQLDSKKHAAMAGFNHGGPVPFGYMPDPNGRSVDPVTGRSGVKLVPHPIEFPALKEAVKMTLHGESLRVISQHWFDAHGITTSTGERVNLSLVLRCLRSPRLCGYRLHGRPKFQKGVKINEIDYIVRDDNGKPLIAHKPACDRATWDRLQVALTKSHRERATYGSARDWLLPTLLICPTCGRSLGNVQRDVKRVNDVRRIYEYRCTSRRRYGPDACSRGVAVRADDAEQYVVLFVAAHMDTDTTVTARKNRLAANANVADTSDVDALLADAREELATYYSLAGKPPYNGAAGAKALAELCAQAQTQVSDLERQHARLLTKAASAMPLADLGITTGAELRERWDGLSVDEKRFVLRRMIERIEVAPGRGTIEERLTVVPA